MARGLGDLVELTGRGRRRDDEQEGRLRHHHRSDRTQGVTLRILVDHKDRPMPLGRMSAELAQARANRSAAVALAVFTPHTAPASATPLAMVGPDVYAVHEPEADEAVALRPSTAPRAS